MVLLWKDTGYQHPLGSENDTRTRLRPGLELWCITKSPCYPPAGKAEGIPLACGLRNWGQSPDQLHLPQQLLQTSCRGSRCMREDGDHQWKSQRWALSLPPRRPNLSTHPRLPWAEQPVLASVPNYRCKICCPTERGRMNHEPPWLQRGPQNQSLWISLN